ncbi:unnamed protein product [Schistosoma curassoni]|uniref:Epimerase domain-containing protein n=1 Tax=Schistosoma curassoni TaxID=6186 RepID=A0A183KE37_9TREM|nr:unnamed protein product [Schistosoma curassoni]
MQVNDGRVVTNFIAQALNNESITVYGLGEQTRSFQYISDLVNGLVALMESNYTMPVNLGNPVEFTVNELAIMVKNFTGLSTCPPDFLLKIQSHLDKLTSNQQCSSECIFSYKEEDFEFLTLCRPSSSGITSLLTNFLQPPKNSDVTLNVILIYAGLLSEGSAHWLLPNFVLTPTFLTDFVQHLSTLHPKPVSNY